MQEITTRILNTGAVTTVATFDGYIPFHLNEELPIEFDDLQFPNGLYRVVNISKKVVVIKGKRTLEFIILVTKSIDE